MTEVIRGLEVNRERMLANMDDSQGMLFSSHLLLAVVAGGLSREEAYKEVQRLSHSLKPGETLRAAAASDGKISKLVSAKVLDVVFSGRQHKASIRATLERAGLFE